MSIDTTSIDLRISSDISDIDVLTKDLVDKGISVAQNIIESVPAKHDTSRRKTIKDLTRMQTNLGKSGKKLQLSKVMKKIARIQVIEKELGVENTDLSKKLQKTVGKLEFAVESYWKDKIKQVEDRGNLIREMKALRINVFDQCSVFSKDTKTLEKTLKKIDKIIRKLGEITYDKTKHLTSFNEQNKKIASLLKKLDKTIKLWEGQIISLDENGIHRHLCLKSETHHLHHAENIEKFGHCHHVQFVPPSYMNEIAHRTADKTNSFILEYEEKVECFLEQRKQSPMLHGEQLDQKISELLNEQISIEKQLNDLKTEQYQIEILKHKLKIAKLKLGINQIESNSTKPLPSTEELTEKLKSITEKLDGYAEVIERIEQLNSDYSRVNSKLARYQEHRQTCSHLDGKRIELSDSTYVSKDEKFIHLRKYIKYIKSIDDLNEVIFLHSNYYQSNSVPLLNPDNFRFIKAAFGPKTARELLTPPMPLG